MQKTLSLSNPSIVSNIIYRKGLNASKRVVDIMSAVPIATHLEPCRTGPM